MSIHLEMSALSVEEKESLNRAVHSIVKISTEHNFCIMAFFEYIGSQYVRGLDNIFCSKH